MLTGSLAPTATTTLLQVLPSLHMPPGLCAQRPPWPLAAQQGLLPQEGDRPVPPMLRLPVLALTLWLPRWVSLRLVQPPGCLIQGEEAT